MTTRCSLIVLYKRMKKKMSHQREREGNLESVACSDGGRLVVTSKHLLVYFPFPLMIATTSAASATVSPCTLFVLIKDQLSIKVGQSTAAAAAVPFRSGTSTTTTTFGGFVINGNRDSSSGGIEAWSTSEAVLLLLRRWL